MTKLKIMPHAVGAYLKGVGVESVELDANNHLIVYLDNGEIVNAGEFKVDDEVTSGSKKPVAGGTLYQALANKVEKEDGKGLSTNDYTDEGKRVVSEAKNALPSITTPVSVEIGTYSDADGITPSERATRARTSVILRKDLVGQFIAPPKGYFFYTFLLDKDRKVLGTRSWVDGNGIPSLNIDTLPDNVVYLTMAIKNSYDGNSDITEEDLSILQNWARTTLSPISKTAEWDYAIRANAGIDNAITIKDGIVSIQAGGFGITWKGNLYYVANTNTSVTTPYTFNLGQYSNHYLVLNTKRLLNKDARNELSELISMRTSLREGDIPIAYHYLSKHIVLMGQFKDLYEPKNDAILSNSTINTDILFAPDYYSFCRGKKMNAAGEGTEWFKRFTLAHFSDVHNYYDLFAEGLNVVQSKATAIVNCGDDSRGNSASDANTVKADLEAIAGVVSRNNKLPYIPNVGNHDFTGLTKKEYFERICGGLTDVVWGDATNYRVYGYIDFTGSGYEGNYRIITLDPMDYADGLYPTPYYNMSVVFSQKQIDWLINTLLDAATKGLNVITTMHYSFGDNSLPFGDEQAKPDAYFCQDAFMIPDIVKAIQTKTALNKSYNDREGLHNITINKDFSTAADLKYVCHLFGHIHSKNAYRCQKTNGEKYDMLMLGELSLAQNGAALAKTYREQNTVNNMSFSVLAIDTEEQSVYRISYGAFKAYNDVSSARVEKFKYRYNE